MAKTRATRASLVKDFASKLATGKLKLPKDEFSSYKSGECEYTFTRKNGNVVIYLFKKGTTDRLATVYMDSKGNVTYKVMPFVDWEAKATRPQPKSTYKAIKNTSYRSGTYLSGTNWTEKCYDSQYNKASRCEYLEKRTKKGELLTAEKINRSWHVSDYRDLKSKYDDISGEYSEDEFKYLRKKYFK